MTEAIVAHVNATGGIAGRQVEPIYHNSRVDRMVTPQGREQEAQAVCATWTEDHQVFAFSAYALQMEGMLECAARTKTPMIASLQNAYPSQRRFESMAEYWYGPSIFVADRRERSVASFLVADGFFDSRSKVGLMIEDQPGIREGTEKALKPTLAAAGITPAVEIVYPDVINSSWSNYVLQMQTAGVTHVLFSASTLPGWATLFMMRAAENQRYRPKWGLGTDTTPAATGSDAPREQAVNVRGLGWSPNSDTGDSTPQSANARICWEVVRDAGQSEDSLPIAWGTCEPFFFLRAAFERASVISSSGLAAGVANLGDGYASMITIGGATRFGAGRHDGVSFVQPFAFDPKAGDFRYMAAPQPVAR